MLELSGVLGGAPSLASSSAIRAVTEQSVSLRLDLSRLREDQADQFVSRESEERFAIHGYGELNSRNRVNPSSRIGVVLIPRPLLINELPEKVFTTLGGWIAGRWRFGRWRLGRQLSLSWRIRSWSSGSG